MQARTFEYEQKIQEVFRPRGLLDIYGAFLFLSLHRKPKIGQVGNKTQQLTHTPFLSFKLHGSKAVISKRQRRDVSQCLDHRNVYTPTLLPHTVLAGRLLEGKWGGRKRK